METLRDLPDIETLEDAGLLSRADVSIEAASESTPDAEA